MKTINAAREAAKSKSKSAAPAENTARVCIGTAEKIEYLAEVNNQPAALIAGAIAEIGIEFLQSDENASRGGTSWDRVVMDVIQRNRPKPRCTIAILASEYTDQLSKAWIKDLERPLDEWLGHMVEIGINHYYKDEVLFRLLPNFQQAFFLTMAERIKGDVGDGPAVMELLKPAPAAPSAFLSFERGLAKTGGAA